MYAIRSYYAWDFGDGGTSTEQNPTYVYTAEGTYSPSLTVTGPCASDTLTNVDQITVTSSAPVAGILFPDTLPVTGSIPFDVQFTDASTGAITDWLWDFGDGGTSTEIV